MLRTKQIGTLSSSARSFFLSGTRCGAADGSSCSCPEDDNCTPRTTRQQQLLKKDVPVIQKPPTIVSAAAPFISRTAKSVPSSKPETIKNQTVLPKHVETVSYATDLDSSSPQVSEQFFRAGVAAVSFLSDLVNYKLQISSEGDGTAVNSAQNYMVDPKRPASNIKSSNVKTYRSQNVHKAHPRSSPNTNSSSENATFYTATNNKGDDRASKSTDEGFKAFFDGNSVERSDFKKTSAPRRSKAYPNSHRFFPNSSNPESRFVENNLNFSKPGRNARVFPGVTSSRQFSNSIHNVDSASNILMQMGWGPMAESALRKLNLSMDAYQANQVLKKLQDHMVALGFFNWLKKMPGFKHDGHTYTTMIGILGRAKQFGEINNLLDEMVRGGCHPNVVTYNRLIHSYGRANFLSKAMNVFEQMKESGCEPDRVTYCTLIDIHAKAGFLDVAMDMYGRMQVAGLSPDTFTYSVMINCLGKAGYLADAQRLFRELVDQGCVPNVVTYNIMIALQAKARNYEVALELYRDMQNAGYEPDKVTYSIVMEALGHCGYLEEAESIFIEMGQKNWVPDEPVYGLLVDLWGKAGRVDKASHWYRSMLEAGLRPNVPTCNSLLGAFLRVHRLSDAYDLLQHMLEFGLNPSLQTYTLLLSCCTDAQTSFEMGFCCELMAVSGHPAHMFLLSLPHSGPDGQNVRAHMGKFLDLMHSEDRESKRGLVDAVIDFLHKSGLKEEAGSVWEMAAEKNVYPEAVKEKASSYWLINLHVMSDGTAVTALSRTLAWFRKQMLVSGVGPNRIDIVTGWGRRSRVTGTSLVRQSVQELLNIFSFPFFTENGNSGCFVGCGEPLNQWLQQSYVERMHLL